MKNQMIVLKSNRRSLYFYEDKVLDLTGLTGFHHFSKKALESHIYKDITHILFNIFPHDH